MRHPRRWILSGSLLVVVGVAIWLSTLGDEFGWFAYAPLDDTGPFEVRTSSVFFVDGQRLISLVVAVIGLLAISAGAGFAAGRRRPR